MIKVLHLFTTLDGGGVESFLYNYYSHMDLAKIKFDAIVPGSEIGYMESNFIGLNSEVFHVKRFRENPIKHLKDVATIIKNGNYDIVHCHGYKSTIGLLFARIFGCKVRIIHSHMAFVNESLGERAYRMFLTYISKLFATNKFACGVDAAKWLFGDKDYKTGNVMVIDNAIDLSKYAYNESVRSKLRSEMNLEENFVLGNVARLTYQKNQSFLLHIMKELVVLNPNSKLLLIGEGEDRNNLEKECRELGIENHVKFLGVRKDVPELLSAIDFFVLPSRYEGLPVVLVEIQAAGLQACISDKITREINVTGDISYLSLDITPKKWAENIFNLYTKNHMIDRFKLGKSMENGKYDIMYQAEKLYKLYLELIKQLKKV
ncbi:glycosyltransferase family 1 protein [Clostridium paridis]|uniref:Glycosyltransferase family 1 protein n=1 Tax=Clostridium paridis TaxID=2803863 RepID=A0A937FJ28_9CLOT|nr:glycosyltransferase family 1 protein [Clostridium paridis]MBL4932596.1 glycosyltransferase family 1 protein [Clostridium paridis]